MLDHVLQTYIRLYSYKSMTCHVLLLTLLAASLEVQFQTNLSFRHSTDGIQSI